MIKYLLFGITLFFFKTATAQHYLILKKRYKTINQFWKDEMIAFQLTDNTWQYGGIIAINKDSIYIKPLMIQYSFMHADTLVSFVKGFALRNIHAFPKPGVVVDYDSGNFRINKACSHVQALCIKNGWIFRVGALGYAALNIINSTANNDLSIENNGVPLSVSAGVLAAGVVLDKIYKPKYILGRKYHIEVSDISNK
jgi:hypothetical protein